MIDATTAAGYTLNLGAVGIVGTFLGMPLEALILGTMAGAITHGLRGTSTRTHGISTVLTSALLAGAFSPLVIGWLIHELNFAEEGARIAFLQPLVPVLIGAAWPWFMPIISDGLKRVAGVVIERVLKFFDAWGGK